MKSKKKMAEERIAQLEWSIIKINGRIEMFREQVERENSEREALISTHKDTIARLKQEHGLA